MRLSVSAARVFEVTVRILNRTLTASLLTRDSPEYQDFARQLLHEVQPRAGQCSPLSTYGEINPDLGSNHFGIRGFDSNSLHHLVLQLGFL